jgi:hypothetical protein
VKDAILFESSTKRLVFSVRGRFKRRSCPEGALWHSGFFEETLVSFLEKRQLTYLVVARITTNLKRKCAGIQQWTSVDAHYAVGEFRLKLFGWSTERRSVVEREQAREAKAAVGRKLLDVPGYTFRAWVTNRTEAPLALWRDYSGRATVEQRIEELKNEERTACRRLLLAAVLCNRIGLSGRAVWLQFAEPLPASAQSHNPVPPAGHLTRHDICVRCDARSDGP